MERRSTTKRAHPVLPSLLGGALLLLTTACGADEATPTTGDGAAGACLSGAENCEDFPTGTGGITSGPDGSVTVEDALSVGIDGPFLISGYWVDDSSGPQLCAVLMESFPPQCGLPAIAVQAGVDQVPAGLSQEGDVSWSEEPVSIEGEIVDGVFVAGSP